MNSQKTLFAWIPVLVLMALIFTLSSLPGELVGQVAQPIEAGFNAASPASRTLEIDWLKVGHIIGYAGLGLAGYYAIRTTTSSQPRFIVLFTVLMCAIYAMTDEFHQTFVAGRTGRTIDVILDTGASLGALVVRWLFTRRGD
jgi:VanZ family protein